MALKLIASEVARLIHVAIPIFFITLVRHIVSLVTTKWAFNLFLHPLAKYPGPKSWAASRLPYTYYLWNGRHPFKIKQLHDRYGEIVRVGPDELSFNSARAYRDVYVQQPLLSKDPRFYAPPHGMGPGKDIFKVDDVTHARYRRIFSHAFSERALREQEPVILQSVDLLIRRLKENAGAGSLDLLRWFNYTTFDIIGDLSLGESFGCLENSQYHKWVSILFKRLAAGVWFMIPRQFAGLESLIFMLLPENVKRTMAKPFNEHTSQANEKVRRRVKLGADRPDFISALLRNNDENGMTMQEIEANASILILAGSETTATLLGSCIYYLLKNPQSMEKAKSEIRHNFTSDSKISMSSTRTLTYLPAVLNETLRIHPPVPIGLARKVENKEGQYVCGQWLPQGTEVSVHNWSASRSPSNFTSPDEFIPERWLGGLEYAGDRLDAAQPFSLGLRGCIGKSLALSEARVIIARILWNFDITLQLESMAWAEQLVYIVWDKSALHVELKLARR